MDTKNEARNFQTNHWIIDKNILSTNWKNNKKKHTIRKINLKEKMLTPPQPDQSNQNFWSAITHFNVKNIFYYPSIGVKKY